MTASEDKALNPDRPLVDPAMDELGYAPFAEHLADSIIRQYPQEGLVMAIYGPWGSGKSTLLNFIKANLAKHPKHEQPIVVHFNPWWFSGKEELTLHFFEEIAGAFKSNNNNDLAEKVAKFSDAVAEAPLPYAKWAKVISILFNQPRNVVAKKKEISLALQGIDRKILVVIDDLDRLMPDEVRQIFQLVKAVADFPNTVYLLAFDKEVVVKALGEAPNLSGDDYLEKIVQVPFELPLPDKVSLHGMLFGWLNILLADVPEDGFDQVYWGNVFHEGIAPFLDTPRDVVRLVNTLSVTYPAIKEEVNLADFIAVEALRVFAPTVYDAIRRNPGRFSGHSDDRTLLGESKDERRPFYDKVLDQVTEEFRHPVKDILLRLFPKLECVWSNTHYGADFLPEWRRELRVCCPDCFPVYFRLSLPPGAISQAEIKAGLALLEQPDEFTEFLLDLAKQIRPDGHTRVSAFLERMEDFTGEIPESRIQCVIGIFFKSADQLSLSQDEGKHLFDIFDNPTRLGRLTFQLLKRVDEPQRFEFLRNAIQESRSVSFIVRQVTVLGQQHGKYSNKEPRPEDDRLLNSEHLQALEELALVKIEEAKDGGRLLDTPELPSVLYRWKDWGDEKKVMVWVKGAIASDAGLTQFLGHFIQESYSQAFGDSVGRTKLRLDPKWLESFVSPDAVADRARKILEDGSVQGDDLIPIRRFLKEYDLRKQGKNPEDVE